MRVRDFFNMHAATTVWNAGATMLIAAGCTPPHWFPNSLPFDISTIPAPALVGLGLLFTAASSAQWLTKIIKKAIALESSKRSDGDEPSVRGP
jgi:hypothetical protein